MQFCDVMVLVGSTCSLPMVHNRTCGWWAWCHYLHGLPSKSLLDVSHSPPPCDGKFCCHRKSILSVWTCYLGWLFVTALCLGYFFVCWFSISWHSWIGRTDCLINSILWLSYLHLIRRLCHLISILYKFFLFTFGGQDKRISQMVKIIQFCSVFWAYWLLNKLAPLVHSVNMLVSDRVFDNKELSVQGIKLVLLCNLWVWSKLFIISGFTSTIDFVDWLGACWGVSFSVSPSLFFVGAVSTLCILSVYFGAPFWRCPS